MRSRILFLGMSSLLGCDLVLGIEDRNPTASGDTFGGSPAGASSGEGSTTSSSTATGGTGGGPGGGGGSSPCSPDLETDPQHCGACDHDCLHGECAAGRCQPFALNAPLPDAEYKHLLVEDGPDGDVYFSRWRLASGARVYRVGKTPQVGPTTLATLAAGGWTGGIAMTSDDLFFTNYSDSDSDPVRGVYRVPRSGGAPTQLVFDDPSLSLYWGTEDIAVDGADLYFTSWFGRVALGKSTVTGDDVTPLWELGTDPPYYEMGGGLLVEDGWAYVSGVDAGIVRSPTSGGAAEPLYDALEAGGGYFALFEISGGYLYWIDGDAFLRRAPVDGTGPIEVIARDVARDATVRDGWLYFITDDQRAIHRLPLADLRAPEDEVATSQDGGIIACLALDETSIFWLSYFGGQVYRQVL